MCVALSRWPQVILPSLCINLRAFWICEPAFSQPPCVCPVSNVRMRRICAQNSRLSREFRTGKAELFREQGAKFVP
eukprot:5961323-Pleurochrysis_carterae.AAC.2